MKRFLLLIAAVAVILSSCQKINNELDALDKRLDKLEQKVPTVDEQITSIQVSITALEAVDKELDECIKTLEDKDEAIDAEIDNLKARDEAINAKITGLKEYVDNQLESTSDWATATFATLEQYNALVSEIAGIKNALDSFKIEVSANLTNAIANLDSSIKLWVGEQLAGYYTIAEVEAKITALQTAITEGNAALQEELKILKSQLETTAAEITAAYKKAIEEAINTNNGVIDTKIANEIASVNQRITNEVATINAKIATIEQRLSDLEGRVTTIEQQIEAINTTLANLDTMDKELKGYIDGLTATATNLQEQINATNTKIEEVKTALQGEISTAKADVLAQLESTKTELEGELAQINSTIETLKAKDAELDGKIANLQTYVNTELGKTTDWVSATFATLEQYNALVSEVATIKEQIKAINQSIADLETRLTTKIEDITTAVSTLNADVQQKVKEITEMYTAAVKTAKEEITSAYTSAIQTAISALDVTLKAWVGEQLAGYYTIAEVEALLATLEQEVNNKIDAQKAYLESLIGELSATTAKSIADNKLLIDALRSDMASLQGESASNAAKIIENSTAIAQNAQDIIDNAAAIANNSDNIEANEQLIANIKPFIDANTNAVADNKRAIDALRISTSSIIATNAENIATNAENIAKSSTLISKNAAAIANNQLAISQNAADILQLQQHFASIESEFEEICQRIIREAISNNGTISSSEALALNTRIENEISTFNYQIALIATRVSVLENEVATIKQQIANILSDVANLKDSVSKLLARIQSISYIPKYEDGKATIEHNGTMSKVVLDFEISPKSAVSELANVWRTAVSIQAVYTHTRAVSFVDMPILSFYADTYNGAITIVASGEKLSEEFFAGSQTASARLSISDGNNSVVSGYIPLEIQSVMEYTTYNEEIVIPSASPEFEIISNTYEKGVGKMVFAGRLTKITTQLFNNCTTLTSVTIPVSVRSIEQQAFQKCSKLSIVYVHPITPPALGSGVFTNASSNLVIHVPYMSIDAYKRCWSAYKSKIHDPSIANNTIYYTTSDGEIVTNNDFEYSSVLFGANIVSNTYENGQGIITFDSDVTIIGGGAFQYSATLTSLIIPRSVKTIYNHAFYECSSLTKIACYAAEPPILGDYDVEDEAWRIDYSEWDQITIYVPASLVNTYKTNECWSSLSDNIVGL